MNNQPQVNEIVSVYHRSEGNPKTGIVRIASTGKKPHIDKVGKVYSDGAVELAHSREVWVVEKAALGWKTVAQQRR